MDESETIEFPAHQCIEDILPVEDIEVFPSQRISEMQLKSRLDLQRDELRAFLGKWIDYSVERERHKGKWLYVFPNKRETRTSFCVDASYQMCSFGFVPFSKLEETLKDSRAYMRNPAVINAVNLETGEVWEYVLNKGVIGGSSQAEFYIDFGESK